MAFSFLRIQICACPICRTIQMQSNQINAMNEEKKVKEEFFDCPPLIGISLCHHFRLQKLVRKFET